MKPKAKLKKWSISGVPVVLDFQVQRRAERNGRSVSAQVIRDMGDAVALDIPRARGKAATTSARNAGH